MVIEKTKVILQKKRSILQVETTCHRTLTIARTLAIFIAPVIIEAMILIMIKHLGTR